jgi:hypothetical protein
VSDYLSQTEIGKLFGATSHEVGKWLFDIGLRNEWKKPSKRAFDEGFVRTTGTGRGLVGSYYYVWHKARTVAALQSAGHRLRPHFDPQMDGRLQGPFEARKSSAHGFELTDANGHVAIWVMGQKNADRVTAVLNLAFKHGIFK